MHRAALVVNHLNHKVASGVTIQVPSLSIAPGSRVALLGLNGAGKTTLLKLLTGATPTAAGVIGYRRSNQEKLFANCDLAFKKDMGYQADTMLPLFNMTGADYLRLCARLKNSREPHQKTPLAAIAEHWQIADLLNKKMSDLSKGNLQKLIIAQAFINRPNYLFFDEPCQNLDPLEQEKFNQLIRSLQGFQICFFSTHNVEQALSVADDIILFHQSRIVFHFSMLQQKQNNYLLVTKQPLTHLPQLEQQFAHKIRQQSPQIITLEGIEDCDLSRLQKAFQDQQTVALFLPQKESLLPLFRMIASGELGLAAPLCEMEPTV